MSRPRGSIAPRRLAHPRQVIHPKTGTPRLVSTVYDVTVSVRNEDGTVSKVRRRGFNSRAEAEAARTRLLHENDRRRLTPPRKGDVNFGAFLHGYVRERVASGHLRYKTGWGYLSLIDRHLVPKVGNWRFDDLTTPRLDAVIQGLNEGVLSSSTVHHICSILSGACKVAVRRGLLASNPMNDVEKPRIRQKRWPKYSPEAVVQALSASPEPQRWALAVGALTGLRRSEVVGLTWGAVDFKAMQIEVKQGIHRVSQRDNRGIPLASAKRRGSGLIAEPPKSAASARILPLGDAASEALRRALRGQKERMLALGTSPTPDTPCFDRGDGTFLSPDSLSHAWRKACVSVGVEGLRLHDLRGHHASAMLEAGVDVKTVSDLMGHAQPSTTMTHYAKELQASRRRAVTAAEQALGGAL